MSKSKFAFLLFLIMAIIPLLFAGCLVKTTTTSVCDNIPMDSYSLICSVASAKGVSVESIGLLLEIANTTALASNAYTAKEAKAFVTDVYNYIYEAKVEGLVYTVLMSYVMDKYNSLPAAVKASLKILQDLNGVSIEGMTVEVFSDYDCTILLGHLDNQLEIIQTFITE